jgi:N-formylglutamate amidohydrolase
VLCRGISPADRCYGGGWIVNLARSFRRRHDLPCHNDPCDECQAGLPPSCAAKCVLGEFGQTSSRRRAPFGLGQPAQLGDPEDSFVDELFACAPQLGAPLLSARFPRAYLDVNREAYELDPTMFSDVLPSYINAGSPRVRIGLGTIARIVANGENIYAGKLRFADAERRIECL